MPTYAEACAQARRFLSFLTQRRAPEGVRDPADPESLRLLVPDEAMRKPNPANH